MDRRGKSVYGYISWQSASAPRIMADAFERVANGRAKAPDNQHAATSHQVGVRFIPVSGMVSRQIPRKKIIQTAHTAELAVGFGRKVSNLINQEDFQEVFPGIELSADSKAAGRWNTNKKGDYFAIGVGGAVTGKGADVLIIDDPHSEQEAASALTTPKSTTKSTSGTHQAPDSDFSRGDRSS